MREQAKELINSGVQKVREKVHLEFVKKTLVKLYFASPPKIQFALAKYGVKAVMNKNKEELDELIRH
jgi:hypothetical protein